MALDDTGEALPFADTDDIDFVFGLELIHEDLVAGFHIIRPRSQRELAHELRAALDASLFQPAGGRLVDPVRLDVLKQPELHRIVTVRGGRLALHHHARAGFQQRYRHHLSVGTEQLRHSNLLAKDSWTHVNFLEGT